MKLKFQIIDADYFLNTNKPIVRIFGKTEDGTTICGLSDKLAPYFYIKLPSAMSYDRALDLMEEIKEIRAVEQIEKFLPFGYQQKKTKLVKITLTNPQDVPKLREKLAALGIAEQIFEADILFKYRFLIDNKIVGMQWVEADVEREQKTVKSKVVTYKINSISPTEQTGNAPLKYMALDIECLPGDPTKPIDSRKDPIVIISLAFYPEHRGNKTLVLVAKPFSGEGVQGFKDEKEMMAEFINIIDTYEPDIMTGYNINAFDFPYILERLKQHKIPNSFGRSDKDVFSRTSGITQEYVVSGRIVVDPYQILKRDPWVKFHRYDLNTVAKELLNEEKHDVEYSEMKGLWNGDREKLMRFVEYARKDAELSLKLVVDRGMLDKFFELSKISGLLLQDNFGGQTKRIETMLLHEFRNRGFVMPSMPSRREMNKSQKDRQEKGLKGAIVLEPKKGLHKDGCVLVLDFKSLYPSIMRTYNISPDTVLLHKQDLPGHQSPSGAFFVDETIQKGIFPDVLGKLVEARSTVKKQMKITKNDEEKRILNAKQLALKDISNSFYGYTGYMRARLYMIDVANAVTAYGRENIEKTRKTVETNFPVEVVYGDTDSIFVKTPITDLEDAKILGEKISKYVTDNLPGHLELDFEKIYKTFLILTKKRYAGWRFDKTGDVWVDRIEMRGIETVRRDWCVLVSDTMMTVLNIVLKEGDLQKAIDHVKDVLDKLRKGQIPMRKLTIIKGITQSLDNYKGVLPHIEVARKLAARNPQDPPKVGDRIGFVIIKGNMMLSKRAEDPTYVEKNHLPIDPDYYIDSQLFPPIERIFSSVGIEKSEILGGGHQMRLSDIFGQKQHSSAAQTEVLGGWDEFICTKCNKSYRRVPINGSCTCGGTLAIGWHGSTGEKITTK